MDKQQEGQWIVPNPQIPRAFGAMNIFFGGILLLFGAGQVALTVYGPRIFKGFEEQARQQLEELKANRQVRIAELSDKVKAAKTEEEKKDLELELQSLKANQGLDPGVFDQAKQLQQDWRLVAYNYAGASAGIALNAVMIVSGVGLLLLAEWARRLAVVTSWLKIARWVTIVVATAFVVVPITTEKLQPMYQSIQAQATVRTGGGTAAFPMGGLAQFSAIITIFSAVGSALIASIYPVFVIYFLTRPRARAACLAARPPSHRGLDPEQAGP
jgi:hypothetical protein